MNHFGKTLHRAARYGLILWIALAALDPPIQAQDQAALFGIVVDPTGAVVPEARVSVVNSRTGAAHSALTNSTGQFQIEALSPDEYMVEVDKNGFKKLRLDRVTVNVRDRQTLRLSLQVAEAAATTVDVTTEVQGISADASSGAVLENEFLENLPINDRSVQSLVLMSPGVTSDAGAGPGDIHVNGLRSNTNYYTLDGVRVGGIGAGGPGGGGGFAGGPPGFGGGAPAGGSAGTGGGDSSSVNAIPLDSLAEMRVQTSAFAPEFGRSPGAQVVMSSRGGTNTFHGSLYEFFRNGDLNAAQFFANATGLPTAAMRQNRYGATSSGRVPKIANTFFFLSYEGLELDSPQSIIDSVPDATTRSKASAKAKPFLNAYPIANGPSLGSGAAQFYGVYSDPLSTRAGSARFDHTFNTKYTFFARYSYTSSSGNNRSLLSPNIITDSFSLTHALTVSLLTTPNATTTNDLRANFSTTGGDSHSLMDNFGGAVPLTDSEVFPSSVGPGNGQFSFMILGASGYSFGNRSKNRQQQFNVVDGLTLVAGDHAYKLGVDVLRFTPTYYRQPYSASITFNGIAATNTGGLLTGLATNAVVSSNVGEVHPEFLNFSAYAQDTWKASPKVTITYGLRWDVNPAPGVRKGERPLALTNSTYFPLTSTEPLYGTRWKNIAPRLGVAYQVSNTPGHETVVRFGFGFFYDAGYGLINSVFSSVPYTNSTILTLLVFPLTAANLAPPGLPAKTPYTRVSTADNGLQAPLVKQASLSVEHYFGRGQLVSVGLVHTGGSNLLLNSTQPSFSSQYDLLSEISNGGSSAYNGLQVQYRRRLSTRLTVQAGWTWSHSLDTASNDFGFGAGFASFSGGSKGNSDFDIRHNLTASGSYLIPNVQGWLKPVTKNWFAEWNAIARTGLPFDVVGVSSATSNSGSASTMGVFGQSRPNLTGAPIWISDPNAPGGRRLNPAAFAAPTGYAQGNLGRNALRGFGAAQLDFSIRRQLAFSERVRLNFSAEAYNIFNHPNFANPDRNEGANLASPNFGVVTRTLNQSFGGGTSVTATGGSRMMEFVVRLQF